MLEGIEEAEVEDEVTGRLVEIDIRPVSVIVMIDVKSNSIVVVNSLVVVK